MGKHRGCLLPTFIYTFTLLVLLFIIIFVIAPVIFKYSTSIQRGIIFPTWATENANFSNIHSFDLKGVKNFYVTVDETENVTLGAWQILPNKFLSDVVNDENYNYEEILSREDTNILLYLHGNGATRAYATELYKILRNYFQVIAVDYRGYGDSSNAEITENNIVNDIAKFYKWIRGRTKARIFFWGHSLGTGVSTHTISNLKAENHVPSGLILETPFSTVPDVMERHFYLKMLHWLPWYRTTMLEPIFYNNFAFESTKYIVDVDCPIMILHAKDDSIVPYDLATTLYEVATKNRNLETQGNVTYHLFEAVGYDHMLIFTAPELPTYIKNFVDECIEFEANSNNVTDVAVAQLA